MRRGTFTKSVKQRIYEREGGRCYHCNCRVRYRLKTVDHVIPKMLGKQFDKSWNLVLSCGSCNRRKGHDLPRFRDFVFVFEKKLAAEVFKNIQTELKKVNKKEDKSYANGLAEAYRYFEYNYFSTSNARGDLNDLSRKAA